jgi:hypothetical protein
MKRFLSAAAAVLLTASMALGANIALRTGPIDPSGTLAVVNQLVQDINSGVGGLLNAQTADVATTAVTTEEILQTYTLPANTLSAAGQSLRITCPWTTGATGNNKTVKLYFGASSIATPAYAGNAQNGRLQLLVMRTGAATQKVFGSGMAGTGSITPVAETYTAGTDNLAAAVTIKCTGTNGTAAASDIVAHGMIVELSKCLEENDASKKWFKGPSVDKDATRKDTAPSPTTLGPRQ